ncbi:MAG: VOC family protein [Pyrinomonadaceae bacterium]
MPIRLTLEDVSLFIKLWLTSGYVTPQEGQMTKEDQFIPHLVVNDGKAALKFYKEVFDAEEGDSMMEPDGTRLMHGEIVLDGHKLFLSDEFSEKEGGTCRMPQTLGGTSVRITLETSNADAIVERAVARGAQIIMPVQDMFWGARYGKIKDPFGHEWGINQQLQERTPEETDAAAAEFFANRNK